jgi:hypothetical protein
MENKNVKKIVLKKETISNLDDNHLSKMFGGRSPNSWDQCTISCFGCPKTTENVLHPCE